VHTVGLYPSIAPAYVGDPSTYTGSPWEVHFTTTSSSQTTGKNYVILSVGLAAVESDLFATLNGTQLIYHAGNKSDPMIRSADAGYYQWAAFEWPIADLNSPGVDNVLKLDVNSADGVMYDALRLELAANSANPSVTGWHDYEYINSSGNNAADANDALGLTAQNLTLPNSSVWIQSGGGSWTTSAGWANNTVPDAVGASAYLGTANTGPFNIALDANHTLGNLYFNSTNAYTISAGNSANNTLIMDNGAGTALIDVLSGGHTISAPMQLNSATSVSIANIANSLTISGSIAGAGSLTETGNGTLVLGNSNSYAGPTTITSGTMIVNAANGLPNGSSVVNHGVLNVNAANSIAQITGSGALNIGAAGALTLPGGAASSQAALSIAAGGLLTLNNAHNTLTLSYGTKPSPDSTIRKYLQNGFNAGHWDAGGTLANPTLGAITSNTAAGSNAFSIGYADGSDGAVTGLSGGQEEIKFTYAGDANLDGQVNISDLSVLASHFGSTGAGWDAGDFSYDGTVNLTDLSILANHFGEGIGSPLEDAAVHSEFAADLAMVEASNPAFAAAVGTAIPEPAALTLLSVAGFGLLQRRQRRNA
jgi:autotransporter-associated beta strand protein